MIRINGNMNAFQVCNRGIFRKLPLAKYKQTPYINAICQESEFAIHERKNKITKQQRKEKNETETKKKKLLKQVVAFI